MEARARRAAKRLGLAIQKSRESYHLNNQGRFRVFNPSTNQVVDGVDFERSAEEVIERCSTIYGRAS
jgi:hypothetical protein